MLAEIPLSRGTYHTDGQRLFHRGREVPAGTSGTWRVRLNSGYTVVGVADLAGIWETHVGASRIAVDAMDPPQATQSTSDPPPTHPGASCAFTEPITTTPVGSLGLGGRVTAILAKAGVTCVEALPRNREELVSLLGVGEAYADDILQAMGRVGALDPQMPQPQ